MLKGKNRPITTIYIIRICNSSENCRLSSQANRKTGQACHLTKADKLISSLCANLSSTAFKILNSKLPNAKMRSFKNLNRT